MHIETFKEGRTKYVKLPATEFQQLIDELEDLRDIKAVRAARRGIAEGEETVPAELVYALADAPHLGARIALWRKHRGMKRDQLAGMVGVQGPYISMIENGKRKGDINLFRALAAALKCDVDDLL